MTGINSTISDRLSALAEAEEQLASILNEATGDVARSRCFDKEQRAEVYAILEAMRSDVQAHSKSVGQWVSDRTGEVSDV